MLASSVFTLGIRRTLAQNKLDVCIRQQSKEFFLAHTSFHRLAKFITLDPHAEVNTLHIRQHNNVTRLLSFGSLLFPGADDPHDQGLLAGSRFIAWWQEGHVTEGKLDAGRTRLVPMPSGNLKRTALLFRARCRFVLPR